MKRMVIKLLAAIVATILLVSGARVVQAETPTPTPANLHVFTAADEGVAGFVTLIVTVTNSGQTGSALVTLQGALPDHNWFLSDENWSEGDCSYDAETHLLTGSGYIEARHLNDTQTDFENGEANCIVIAQIAPCGSYSASPFIIHDGAVIPGNTASWSKGCVTPVSTPTPIPPTATPEPPTAVPTATTIPPTATPIVIVVTATRTATPPFGRVPPLPPATGSSGPSGSTGGWAWVLAGLLAFGVSLGVIAWLRR